MAKVVKINEKELLADFVGWFTGKSAQREAGNRGQQAPGGFFLVNEHAEQRMLSLSESVEVTSVWADFNTRGEITAVKIELATLIGYFKDPKDIATNIVADPFWITIENGKVVRLDEQYVA